MNIRIYIHKARINFLFQLISEISEHELLIFALEAKVDPFENVTSNRHFRKTEFKSESINTWFSWNWISTTVFRVCFSHFGNKVEHPR